MFGIERFKDWKIIAHRLVAKHSFHGYECVFANARDTVIELG